MRLHANAVLGPKGREGWSSEGPVMEAAGSCRSGAPYAEKLVRYWTEGTAGLVNRSPSGSS